MLIWVQHRQRLRHAALLVRQMVVGHDQVELQLLRLGRRGKRAHARIHRDHQPHAILVRRREHARLHPITFLDAMRHMIANVRLRLRTRTQSLDRRLQQYRGRRAVHVVVAVNEDGFVRQHRLSYPRHRLAHAQHPVGIVQLVERRSKERLCRLRRCDPAPNQQLRDDLANALRHLQRARQCFRCGSIALRQGPSGQRGDWQASFYCVTSDNIAGCPIHRSRIAMSGTSGAKRRPPLLYALLKDTASAVSQLHSKGSGFSR